MIQSSVYANASAFSFNAPQGATAVNISIGFAFIDASGTSTTGGFNVSVPVFAPRSTAVLNRSVIAGIVAQLNQTYSIGITESDVVLLGAFA